MELDAICTQCPLMICDEESLWCCYRWATNPNAAQMALATDGVLRQLASLPRSRKGYYKRYYQANRDRKLAAANERNRAKRAGAVPAR